MPVLVLVLLAASPMARAAGRVQGTLNITFSGTSTLHGFSGSVAATTVSVEQGADGLWSADVTVPVASMNTKDAKRDENLRSMLDETHYPIIRGRFEAIDPVEVQRSGAVAFLLTIRTVEQPMQASVRHWQQTEDRVSFEAEFDVSLQAFHLTAPTALLFIRVGDAVHVTVRVTLQRT